MQSYIILTKGNLESLNGDIEAIREGFNFWFFVFSPLWAIFYRTWTLFSLILLSDVATLMATTKFGSYWPFLMDVAIHVILSFHAYDFRYQTMLEKGYNFRSVVRANDEEGAKLRFLDQLKMEINE